MRSERNVCTHFYFVVDNFTACQVIMRLDSRESVIILVQFWADLIGYHVYQSARLEGGWYKKRA